MKTKAQTLLAIAACILFGCSTAQAANTLTISRPVKSVVNAGPLESFNHRNGIVASLTDVPLEIFELNSGATPNNVTKIKLAIPPGVVRPKSLQMVRQVHGGYMDIGTMPVTASSNEYEFVMPGVQGQVPSNGTRTYVVRGSFDPTAFGLSAPYGDYSRVQVISIKFIPSLEASERVLAPQGFYAPEQRFFRATVNWSLVSDATIQKTVESGITTRMTVTFPLQAVVSGGDITAPKASDFVIIGCIGREVVPCVVTSLTIVPSQARISDGATPNLTLKADLPLQGGELSNRAGFVNFRIAQVNWSVEGTDPFAVEQTWGLESLKTVAVETINTASTPSNAVKARAPLVSHKLHEEMTSIVAPNLAGYAGQVVSEGKAIHIASTYPNGLRRVVFPQVNAAKAQMMQVDVDMSSSDMVPHVFAPADISVDSRGVMVEYPVSNVEKEIVGGNAESVRFEISLGGLQVYGLAERTGNRSCLVRFRWEPGIGSDSFNIGQRLDVLDLSGSLPPTTPDAGTGYPQRFPFRMRTGIRSGSTFTLLGAEFMPELTEIEGSENLVDWQPLYGYSFNRPFPNPADLSWNAEIVIDLDALPASLRDSPTAYFRMKVRN